MTTLTVLLDDSDRPQPELQAALGKMILTLQKQGLAKKAVIEPVFPGDKSSEWKSTFVVRVTDRGEKVASLLSAMPGVQQAFVAPSRR